MEKREKGFTLIELLAVIVILAIIALISTPIMIEVIEKARKGAFEDSAYGVLDAGKIYFVDKIADDNKFEGANFTFPDGGDLKVSGDKPAGGSLSISVDGKQSLALYDKDKKWCAYKRLDEEKITISKYEEETCHNPLVLIGAAKTINDKNTEGNIDGLFTDDFGNVRYYGKKPKNYVTFNNEIWRIIGIFDGQIKLIKNDNIINPNNGEFPYKESNPTHFMYHIESKNDWTVSTLQRYFNNSYLQGLTDTSQKMIATTKYYLGSVENANIDKKTAYLAERGKKVVEARPTEWVGKIALMYLSDYGYAAPNCEWNLGSYNNCANENYLRVKDYNQWLLTPWYMNSNFISFLSSYGGIGAHNAGLDWMDVRPSLYLKYSVKIIGGDGTDSSPYQLSL